MKKTNHRIQTNACIKEDKFCTENTETVWWCGLQKMQNTYYVAATKISTNKNVINCNEHLWITLLIWKIYLKLYKEIFFFFFFFNFYHKNEAECYSNLKPFIRFHKQVVDNWSNFFPKTLIHSAVKSFVSKFKKNVNWNWEYCRTIIHEWCLLNQLCLTILNDMNFVLVGKTNIN